MVKMIKIFGRKMFLIDDDKNEHNTINQGFEGNHHWDYNKASKKSLKPRNSFYKTLSRDWPFLGFHSYYRCKQYKNRFRECKLPNNFHLSNPIWYISLPTASPCCTMPSCSRSYIPHGKKRKIITAKHAPTIQTNIRCDKHTSWWN